MNVAVIGVGNLGRRHLQALEELKGKNEIFGVEINQSAIPALKQEYPWVRFVPCVSELPTAICTAGMATNANVRRELFDQLVSHASVSNIIFEKVLFQTREDYEHVRTELARLGIHAWVNCARREWDAYKRLREELAHCREMHFSACGGNWGLGCNTIHMLDLIEFLSGDKVGTVEISGLQNHLVESKRKGFYEFFGTIRGTAGKCKDYMITCMQDASLPLSIEITTESGRYLIYEGSNVIRKSTLQNSWQWQEEEFKQVYQSQMTGRIVRSIQERGICNLTEYEASMELHLKYIVPLISFFNKNGMEGEICPIT